MTPDERAAWREDHIRKTTESGVTYTALRFNGWEIERVPNEYEAVITAPNGECLILALDELDEALAVMREAE